jgi:uncharacterized protein YraI
MARLTRINPVSVLLALVVLFSALAVAAPARAEGVGTIITANTKVLAGPGARFWTIATARKNLQVPVTGVSADRQFWFVKTTRGNGFVAAQDISVEGGANLPVVATDLVGSVIEGRANVRLNPGVEALGANTLSQGAQFFAIGRSDDGEWIQIRYQFGKGWIRTSVTDVNAAKLPAVVGTPSVLVNTPFVNLRSGPGPQFSVVGIVRGGQVYPILGINASGSWFYIATEQGEAWIDKIYVKTQDYFGGAEVIDAPAPSEAVYIGTIITGSAAVRENPGLLFAQIGTLPARTKVNIVGQSKDKAWWLIQTDTISGWVSKALVRTSAEADNVPVQ